MIQSAAYICRGVTSTQFCYLSKSKSNSSQNYSSKSKSTDSKKLLKGTVRICLPLYCADRSWFSASFKNINKFLAYILTLQIFFKHRKVCNLCYFHASRHDSTLTWDSRSWIWVRLVTGSRCVNFRCCFLRAIAGIGHCCVFEEARCHSAQHLAVLIGVIRNNTVNLVPRLASINFQWISQRFWSNGFTRLGGLALHRRASPFCARHIFPPIVTKSTSTRSTGSRGTWRRDGDDDWWTGQCPRCSRTHRTRALTREAPKAKPRRPQLTLSPPPTLPLATLAVLVAVQLRRRRD